MRILFCTPDIDQGGSARSLSILAERLREKHYLAILSFHAPDPARPGISSRYAGLGIPLSVLPFGWLPLNFKGYRGDPQVQIQRCQAASGNIAAAAGLAAGFDAVCFNSYMSASLAPHLPESLPKFLIAREVLEEDDPYFAGCASMLKTHIRRAVAIGPVEGSQLGRMGIAHEIVYNTGPVTPRLEPLPDFGRVHFGVFSQIVPAKGLHILLLALAGAAPMLRRHRALVHVFGHGNQDYIASLAEMAFEYRLGDVFRLEGWADNVPEKMRAMHCIVRPDLTGSPWGRDVIEAMSIGRPVLATGSENVFIHNGSNGALVPPDDPVALARAICGLAASPRRLERMAQSAFDFARQNFDPDRNAERVDKALFGQLGRGRT